MTKIRSRNLPSNYHLKDLNLFKNAINTEDIISENLILYGAYIFEDYVFRFKNLKYYYEYTHTYKIEKKVIYFFQH